MADVAHDASGPASSEPAGVTQQQANRPVSSDKEKLRVFISYSRDDLGFADQLDAALNACGFECIIDRHGISSMTAGCKSVYSCGSSSLKSFLRGSKATPRRPSDSSIFCPTSAVRIATAASLPMGTSWPSTARVRRAMAMTGHLLNVTPQSSSYSVCRARQCAECCGERSRGFWGYTCEV